MFAEQGAFELIFLAAVALIVVGPKDLPVLMRKVGQFTAKMRGLAAEFRASFDEMARQSELDELRKEVEALKHGVTAPNIHQMMGTGPVKRDLEQHWDELHHGITPAPALAAPALDAPLPAEADSPDSADSVSETRTPPVGGEVHSVHSDLDADGPGAPGGELHSVHSVHSISDAQPRAEPDSADSPDSVHEPYAAPRPEHPPVSTLAPPVAQPVPEPPLLESRG